MKIQLVLCGLLALSAVAHAEKAGLKIKDIPADQDTSIVIKKGAAADQCTEYEVLDGTEEVFGMPDYDRSKALSSWKTACNEWKQSMREMNKENQLLTLNCSSPKATKEDDRFTFLSTGSYRVKVKIRERGK